jgi:cytochrome d ubiquinol oxidase subunit I
MGEMLDKKPRFLNLFVYALLLPYLATSAGWIMTEIGRWPWVVFGLMKIEQAVSPNVSAWMLLITLIGFTVTYGVLMVVDIYLLMKYARSGAGQVDSQLIATPLVSPVGAD